MTRKDPLVTTPSALVFGLAATLLFTAAAGCAGPLSADASKASTQLAQLAADAAGEFTASSRALDAKDLDNDARRRLLALARAARCPCAGVAESLAVCAAKKRCVQAGFSLRTIVRAVRRGVPDKRITKWLAARRAVKQRPVAVGSSPCRGAKDAKVTLVEFSDFECPGCGIARQLVEEVLRQHKGSVRVCYKAYPLTRIHKHAAAAARAAMVAHKAGKFWPMHDRLFDNQRALGKGQLRLYARDAGVDLATFDKQIDSDAIKKIVANDVAQGESLGVDGTPTFFVNGRMVTGPLTLGSLNDAIEEAALLGGGGGAAKPASKKAAAK